MKKYLIHLLFVLIFIFIIILGLLFYYVPKAKVEFIEGGDIQKAQTIDSLQSVIDSLHSEVLPLQIELGRYQVAFDIFMERHPKSAKQYETILSQETE